VFSAERLGGLDLPIAKKRHAAVVRQPDGHANEIAAYAANAAPNASIAAVAPPAVTATATAAAAAVGVTARAVAVTHQAVDSLTKEQLEERVHDVLNKAAYELPLDDLVLPQYGGDNQSGQAG
jgi:hypothetical protein